MNTNTQIDKIDKVLSKISGKEMKAFVWQYAATHEDFATALVEKYWKPERGNYKEQVEACFAHAGVLGVRFGALGVKNKVLTAIRMEPIGEFYTKWKAILNEKS